MKDTNPQWECYENLNEPVCAIDIGTHRLLYRNRKAREVFGEADLPCYQVLQGRSTPCPFCREPELAEGEFWEDVQTNPLLGRTYARKDTILLHQGRRVRLELAIDLHAQEQQLAQICLSNEAILNEGLRLSLAAPDPDEGIHILLGHLGHSFQCDRMYIFEEEAGPTFSNTYEWCAHNVTPQIQNLQKIHPQVVCGWTERFKKEESVIISDLEHLKTRDPLLYSYLAPQEIQTLVAGPLIFHGKVLGFYGVDNPPESMMENICGLFQTMGYFLVSLLRRRDLLRSLERMSHQDQMTGCGNRHGLEDYISALDRQKSIGVVYCDVTGLKRVNDTQGHLAGDDLLLRACGCLKRAFPQTPCFRMGGDEFLVLAPIESREELEERIAILRAEMACHKVLMAVGWGWYPSFPQDFDHVLSQVDAQMYEEKKRHYALREYDRRRG